MGAKRSLSGYLSIRDTARETGLSEGFWRKAVLGKRISYYKIGGRIKIARRDLDLWIEARRIPARENRPGGIEEDKHVSTSPGGRYL